MGHPWARPLLMVWVMISPLSSLHVSSCPTLKRTAHHFHTFLSKASISLWMAPHSTAPWAFVTSTLAMAASRWMATWAETILWSSSGPCFIPTANWCELVMLRTFLVRSLAVALQTSRLMTCPMARDGLRHWVWWQGRFAPRDMCRGSLLGRQLWRVSRRLPTRNRMGLRRIRSYKSSARTFHHQVPWLCWRERI